MREETVTLSRKEQDRVQVLNRVERGGLVGREAAALMGLSVRQVRRLLAGYRREGVVALAHGNRGRRPVQAIGDGVKARVRELAQGRYAAANHHHLTELLGEREGIHLSRSTVRRLLLAGGVRSPRRRRPPKHRRRRERYPQEGMLLQVDGSRHDWLEGRGPWLTLVGAIDDAAGTVEGACFREQEDAQGYFLVLREVIQRKGVPLALYADRHTIFAVPQGQRETMEEQLVGKRAPTQVGRALEALGINLILAHSPQAKGRIERLWGTFQSRLVMELRLAGARTLEEANRVLRDFLLRFNALFAVPPAQPGSAYRPLPRGLDLDGVLCFTYQRTVARDNTVRFDGRALQLLPGRDRQSYARARVEVQERLDGSLVVCHRGHVLATTLAPPQPVTLRARKSVRGGAPPASDDPVDRVNPDGAGVHGRGGDDRGAVLHAPVKNAPSIPRRPGPQHPWRTPVVTESLNR